MGVISALSRHLESGVDPGNEVGASLFCEDEIESQPADQRVTNPGKNLRTLLKPLHKFQLLKLCRLTPLVRLDQTLIKHVSGEYLSERMFLNVVVLFWRCFGLSSSLFCKR